MNRARLSSRPALLAMLTLLVGGCGGGDELKKVDLSGSATFSGKPIVYGTITFTPDKSQGHKGGPQGYVEIIDGKYDTAVNGEGVVPGPHQVRVSAFPKRPPAVTEGAGSPPPSPGPEPLFLGYTMKMDLHESTQDIAIPAEAKGFNRFAPNRRRLRGP